jgi:hypothetical protein
MVAKRDNRDAKTRYGKTAAAASIIINPPILYVDSITRTVLRIKYAL